jgi:hypothetical protein
MVLDILFIFSIFLEIFLQISTLRSENPPFPTQDTFSHPLIVASITGAPRKKYSLC